DVSALAPAADAAHRPPQLVVHLGLAVSGCKALMGAGAAGRVALQVHPVGDMALDGAQRRRGEILGIGAPIVSTDTRRDEAARGIKGLPQLLLGFRLRQALALRRG